MADSARHHTVSTQSSHDQCPNCGRSIRGIAATRPGEHRFVDCGHRASDRFIQPPGDGRLLFAGLTDQPR